MPRSTNVPTPAQTTHLPVPAPTLIPELPADPAHTERALQTLRRSRIRSPGLLWGPLAMARLHRLGAPDPDPGKELLAMHALAAWPFTPPAPQTDEPALRRYLEVLGTALTLRAATGASVPPRAGTVILGLLDLNGDELAGTAYAVILRVATLMVEAVDVGDIRNRLLATALTDETWEWMSTCAHQAAPRGW